MRIRTSILTAAVVLLYCWSANSQTPNAKKMRDPGIHPTPVIDRAEVRVLHVEIAGNAVRSVHTHDDVKFHLFIPVSGKLEITIGSAKPVEAEPGQAFFIEKSTPHGFRNLGSTPALAMEVFVKDGTSASAKEALSAALASAPVSRTK